MSDRQVTQVHRNDDGDITALCHPGEAWSPREKEDAIKDLELNRQRYYVLYNGWEVDIRPVHGTEGPYLRTAGDWTDKDDLAVLPTCHQCSIVLTDG